MNKKIISLVILVSLFCLAGMAFGAVKLENPLGDGTTFITLLEKIAVGVGKLITTLGSVMIIFAGILYLTSGGNPERMNKAKTALVYAVVGIVIGLAAQSIVKIIGDIVK